MKNWRELTQRQKTAVYLILYGLITFIIGFKFKSFIPIARVNNQYISSGEFVHRLALTSGQQVLETLVSEKLIEQSLAEKKIEVTDKELAIKIADIKKQLLQKKTTFESILIANRQTIAQFEKELRIQMSIEKMLKSTIKVTDEEINEYFTINRVKKGRGAIYQSQLLAIRDTIYRTKLRQAFLAWYQLQKGKARVSFFTGI